jgi:hypothetical protein
LGSRNSMHLKKRRRDGSLSSAESEKDAAPSNH